MITSLGAFRMMTLQAMFGLRCNFMYDIADVHVTIR